MFAHNTTSDEILIAAIGEMTDTTPTCPPPGQGELLRGARTRGERLTWCVESDFSP